MELHIIYGELVNQLFAPLTSFVILAPNIFLCYHKGHSLSLFPFAIGDQNVKKFIFSIKGKTKNKIVASQTRCTTLLLQSFKGFAIAEHTASVD